MEVDKVNDEQGSMFMWTMEQHNQFLETYMKNGCTNFNFNLKIISIVADVLGLPVDIIHGHSFRCRMLHFMHRRIVESTTSWTLEDHKKLVEAVIQLGGFTKATPTAVLELMQDRGIGLRKEMVAQILEGFGDVLQIQGAAPWAHCSNVGPMRGKQRSVSHRSHPYKDGGSISAQLQELRDRDYYSSISAKLQELRKLRMKILESSMELLSLTHRESEYVYSDSDSEDEEPDRGT